MRESRFDDLAREACPLRRPGSERCPKAMRRDCLVHASQGGEHGHHVQRLADDPWKNELVLMYRLHLPQDIDRRWREGDAMLAAAFHLVGWDGPHVVE